MAQKHDLKYVLGNNFFQIKGMIGGEDRHKTYIASRELAEKFIDDFENSTAGKQSDWSNLIIIEHNMITDIN